MPAASPSIRHALLLLLGVMALSTAVILIRASHTHPIALAAIRLLLATALLTPFERRERLRLGIGALPPDAKRTWWPALLFSIHFISWAYGARLTAVSQASFIVNLVPVALPFFLYSFAGERISRREIIGTAIVLGGLIYLTAQDAVASSGNATGNLVCFGSMLAFAAYLALGRRNRGTPSLWLYVLPVYRRAALITTIVAIPWLVRGVPWTSPHEWALLIGITVIPTVIGHSLLNRAMRHLRGQIVSLANCGQFIFASITAWFVFGEVPSLRFMVSAAIVIAGIITVIRPSRAPIAIAR